MDDFDDILNDVRFLLLKFDNIVFSKRLKYQIIHYLYFTNIIKLQLLKNANWQIQIRI